MRNPAQVASFQQRGNGGRLDGRRRFLTDIGYGLHDGLGQAEVDAHEVGLAVLEPLRELDEVAYLRFASVYQAFTSLEDFEAAITLLRAERPATAEEPTPRT